MWFRRLFRRRRPPPPVLLPSLDRLAELIERVVALLDEVAARPAPEPRRRAAPASQPAPEPAPGAALNPAPSVDGHVLLVPSPDGYRLREREEAPPARGDLVEVEGETFGVIRLGPSPLPGDKRRCAFLERQEPPRVERTFDR